MLGLSPTILAATLAAIPPAPAAISCYRDTECSDTEICIDKTCVAAEGIAATCEADDDCVPRFGDKCYAGLCKSALVGCRRGEDRCAVADDYSFCVCYNGTKPLWKSSSPAGDAAAQYEECLTELRAYCGEFDGKCTPETEALCSQVYRREVQTADLCEETADVSEPDFIAACCSAIANAPDYREKLECYIDTDVSGCDCRESRLKGETCFPDSVEEGDETSTASTSATQDIVCAGASQEDTEGDASPPRCSTTRNSQVAGLSAALATFLVTALRRKRLGCLTCMCFLAAGCSTVHTYELEDEGNFCMYGDAEHDSSQGDDEEEQSFDANKPAAVEVVLLSDAGGCAKDVEAACIATLTGQKLVIHATGSYSETTQKRIKADCPTQEVPVAARCTTPPLPAGTLEIVYGDARLQLEVPSQRPLLCSATSKSPR